MSTYQNTQGTKSYKNGVDQTFNFSVRIAVDILNDAINRQKTNNTKYLNLHNDILIAESNEHLPISYVTHQDVLDVNFSSLNLAHKLRRGFQYIVDELNQKIPSDPSIVRSDVTVVRDTRPQVAPSEQHQSFRVTIDSIPFELHFETNNANQTYNFSIKACIVYS